MAQHGRGRSKVYVVLAADVHILQFVALQGRGPPAGRLPGRPIGSISARSAYGKLTDVIIRTGRGGSTMAAGKIYWDGNGTTVGWVAPTPHKEE